MSRSVRRLLLLVLLAGAAVPAAASADQLTVDFETGPPLGTAVTNQYLSSAFVQFNQNDPSGGFRPYRTSAPGLARSGTIVADVGSDVCFQDTGGTCEFVNGGTTGRLTRTASSVTLYAGEFNSASSPETARLTAYRANSSVAATSPDTTIDNTGFNKQLTVSSPSGDIAYFTLVTTGAAEGDLGFDDLTMTYPANSLPDVSPAVTNNPVTVLQGQSVDVPVSLTRLNGSTGPVQLSASGLPAGVTAHVVPNPVPGTQQTATLTLTASAGAPGFDVPVSTTVTADPQGDANVAPAVRTTPLLVKVADPYELKLGTGATSDVALPDCAPVDVPIVVARDGTFNGTVTLAVAGLPAGVSAQIEPSATVAPGGDFFADRTIHFSRSAGATLPANVTVRATSAGLADRTMTLFVHRATSTATLASGLGLTPRHLGPGTQIGITGNGFCAGTTVLVGNTDAGADATIVDDHTLTFNVPRLATTGAVTIVPPAGEPGYNTNGSLTVASVRNTNGFSFHNPSYGTLSLSSLTDAFGADDLFFSINPCWPWSDCTISTGILNPIAALDWGILNVALHESGGHCFGISRASQELVSHKVPYARFGTGSSVFSLPGPDGPSSDLLSYLDGQHALQGSAEFLSSFLHRTNSISSQLGRLTSELAAGREPIVTLKGPSFGEGHAVLAYDEQTTAAGVDILVYDNNRQFTSTESTNAAFHKSQEEASVIHIDPALETWSFDIGGSVWSGGNDGSLFVMPQSTIPDNPSLPGIETLGQLLESITFGSADGSVRTVSASKHAQLMPVLDSHATPAAAGWWLAPKTKAPLDVKMRGVKPGHYAETYNAPGFAGAVTDVATAPGVQDQLGGSASGTLNFAGSADRPLAVQLARQTPGSSTAWSATVQTHSFAHGGDTASLTPAGTLGYAHDGAATTFSFTLTRLPRNGGPARFESGPVRIGPGDHVTVKPLGSDLAGTRLTIRSADGRIRTRVLRNRARGVARLSLSGLRLGSTHGRRVASFRIRIAALRANAVAGVAFRLLHGRRVVARQGEKVSRLHNGTRAFSWRFPRVPAGTYRLVVDVRVATTGVRGALVAASTEATRSATVKVGG
jgi:hypothetical protein